jgi:hypothetical protein
MVLVSEYELWLICANEHLQMVGVDGDKAVIQPLKPKSSLSEFRQFSVHK